MGCFQYARTFFLTNWVAINFNVLRPFLSSNGQLSLLASDLSLSPASNCLSIVPAVNSCLLFFRRVPYSEVID